MIEKISLAVSALCVSCVSIAGGIGVEDDSKRAWSAEGSKSRVMTHSQAVDELKAICSRSTHCRPNAPSLKNRFEDARRCMRGVQRMPMSAWGCWNFFYFSYG